MFTVVCPGSVAKHPWYGVVTDPRELPAFLLTNADACLTQESEWDKRDTLIGFGTEAGSARFIELLLNASRASSSVEEIELEGEDGFRGVAPLSCEARMWLPGSFGWKEEFWRPGVLREATRPAETVDVDQRTLREVDRAALVTPRRSRAALRHDGSEGEER